MYPVLFCINQHAQSHFLLMLENLHQFGCIHRTYKGYGYGSSIELNKDQSNLVIGDITVNWGSKSPLPMGQTTYIQTDRPRCGNTSQ